MSSPRLTVAVAALLVLAPVVAVGGLAAGAGDVGPLSEGKSPAGGVRAAGTVQNATQDTNTTNSSLGQRISSFMQSNTAQADGSVETGMWIAAYANASSNASREALVRRRAAEMNTTLRELRAEKRALQRAFRNGSIDRTVYVARLSRIVGRIAALNEGLEAMEPRAEAVGVNRTLLDRLRNDTQALIGREIAEVARELAGRNGTAGPPEWVGSGNDTGPPEDAGPPADRGNASDRNGTAGDGGPGESGGRDGERGSDRGNGTDGGDAGTGRDGDGSGSGSSGGDGSGNGSSGDGKSGDGSGSGSSDDKSGDGSGNGSSGDGKSGDGSGSGSSDDKSGDGSGSGSSDDGKSGDGSGSGGSDGGSGGDGSGGGNGGGSGGGDNGSGSGNGSGG